MSSAPSLHSPPSEPAGLGRVQLAWLAAAAPDDVFEAVIEAYTMGRREVRDPHLVDRARLASELALLRWLMHGVRTENPHVIADGQAMLVDLEAMLFDDEA